MANENSPRRDDVPLHTIEPIVTPDRFEFGVHRMRVLGGWLYWLQPAGGAVVSSFVPFPAQDAIAVQPTPPAEVGAVVSSSVPLPEQDVIVVQLTPPADASLVA